MGEFTTLASNFEEGLFVQDNHVNRHKRDCKLKTTRRNVRGRSMSNKERFHQDGHKILKVRHKHALNQGDIARREMIQKIKREAKNGFRSNCQIVVRQQILDLRSTDPADLRYTDPADQRSADLCKVYSGPFHVPDGWRKFQGLRSLTNLKTSSRP